MRRLQIGIIGSAGVEEYPGKKPDKRAFKIAYKLGTLVASANAILICGGKGGIMEEACKGAKEQDGTTVGVVSGTKRDQANTYVDVEIVSGIVNNSEEALIVSMSDGIIAIGGGAGTLEELALAYRNKKPVIAIKGIRGWADTVADTYLDERELIKINSAKTAKEAMDKLLKIINL